MNSLDLEQEVDPLNVDHFSCTPLVWLNICKSTFLKCSPRLLLFEKKYEKACTNFEILLECETAVFYVNVLNWNLFL